jgi:hypothetical protein
MSAHRSRKDSSVESATATRTGRASGSLWLALSKLGKAADQSRYMPRVWRLVRNRPAG